MPSAPPGALQVALSADGKTIRTLTQSGILDLALIGTDSLGKTISVGSNATATTALPITAWTIAVYDALSVSNPTR